MASLNGLTDYYYMELAVDLAEENIDHIGKVGVGAVLVTKEGQVYDGFRYTLVNIGDKLHNTIHAEQSVLGRCPDPEGGTLYVTMEPCTKRWHHPDNHHYCSCCELIISRGIRRVFIASSDDDFGGGGANYLREHGIEVNYIQGFEEELKALYTQREVHKSVVQHERPQ